MTILFTTTHLTPDTQRIVAWAVQEALAWFLSLAPEGAAATLFLVTALIMSLTLVIFMMLDALIQTLLRNMDS